LHVGQDPFFRNTPIMGPGAGRNTQQPLGLNLSYLLTAYAPANAVREQQAMSIALSCFHEQPVYTGTAGAYLTVSLGSDTLADMSALWQSFTVAYRLSTVFRVAIAFLTPSQPPDTQAAPPTKIGLALAPVAPTTNGAPTLFQPARVIDFMVPPGDTDADVVTARPEQTAAVGGGQVLIGGANLDAAAAANVFLSTLDGTSSWTVTAWRTGTPSASSLVLSLPSAYALDIASVSTSVTPPPGVYLLAVGDGGTTRSVPIPLQVAPRIDPLAGNAPVLLPTNGTFAFTGAGFISGATQLFLGGQRLLDAQVTVDPTGTSVSFVPLPPQPPGVLPLRVRVDGVDTWPPWQVSYS
jgi:hypothetical protein